MLKRQRVEIAVESVSMALIRELSIMPSSAIALRGRKLARTSVSSRWNL
jgi:hypothetical protein